MGVVNILATVNTLHVETTCKIAIWCHKKTVFTYETNDLHLIHATDWIGLGIRAKFKQVLNLSLDREDIDGLLDIPVVSELGKRLVLSIELSFTEILFH